MYIVLDTNIWYSELGLTTARGAALKYYAMQKGATIAVPEVVKREVRSNLKKSLNEARDKIDDNYTRLLSVFGKLKEVVVPTSDEIAEKIDRLFDDLGVQVEHVPFTLQSAEQALSAVIAGEPPNGPRNQQFKDSVIWADCLQLLERDNVTLVTADKGFYFGGDYRKGLATNLREQSEAVSNEITVYATLNGLLEEIAEPAQLDHASLASRFVAETRDSVDRMLERNGFVIQGDPSVDIWAYVTEDPNKLYIDFKIEYRASDTTEAGRKNGTLTLNGDATFDIEDNSFSNFRNKGEELTFEDENGEQQKRNVVMMAGSIVLGHRTVEHTIRHPIT